MWPVQPQSRGARVKDVMSRGLRTPSCCGWSCEMHREHSLLSSLLSPHLGEAVRCGGSQGGCHGSGRPATRAQKEPQGSQVAPRPYSHPAGLCPPFILCHPLSSLPTTVREGQEFRSWVLAAGGPGEPRRLPGCWIWMKVPGRGRGQGMEQVPRFFLRGDDLAGRTKQATGPPSLSEPCPPAALLQPQPWPWAGHGHRACPSCRKAGARENTPEFLLLMPSSLS